MREQRHSFEYCANRSKILQGQSQRIEYVLFKHQGQESSLIGSRDNRYY